MRISDEEVKKLLGGFAAVNAESSTVPTNALSAELDAEAQLREQDLVKSVTSDVVNMPDREEMIAALKARIAAGTYAPSAEEIVDGMIRRAIADRAR